MTEERTPWAQLLYEMDHDVASVCIGLLLTCMSATALAFDLLVLFAIWRSNLLTRGDPLYILSTYAIVDPTIRLIHCTFVWCPSCIFKYTLISKKVMEHSVMSALGNFLQFSILQTLIALNRYWLMTNNSLLNIFTRKFCITFVVATFPVFQLINYLSYNYLACCRLIYDPYEYTVLFESPQHGETDYYSNYIFAPICAIGSVVPIFCYLRIFSIARKNTVDSSPTRTLEFTAIFIFYILFTAGLKIHPLVIEYMPRVLNGIILMFGICDASSVALIQATMNQKVRRFMTDLFAERLSKVSVESMRAVGVPISQDKH